jgi:hypothetical protein
LVVALHLYQKMNVQEYLNGPMAGPVFNAWTPGFFKRHPRVISLLISSNFHRYRRKREDVYALETMHLAIDNPLWEGTRRVLQEHV